MKLKMTGNNVLVRVEQQEKKVGGLVVPDSNKECKFFVEDVGKDVIDVEVGDEVLIKQYDGTEVKVEGTIYRIINEEQILAYINKG